MHLCKVRVVSEVYLSQIDDLRPLKIKILNTQIHITIQCSFDTNRLNLTRQVRDNNIISRRLYFFVIYIIFIIIKIF
jgi:hypothetical protein